MKRFRIRFTPEASRLISKLHPETKKMIRAALDGLKGSPYVGYVPPILTTRKGGELALEFTLHRALPGLRLIGKKNIT